MSNKIYISGKISDLPIEEYTAHFADAARHVEDHGLIAINPVNIHGDEPKTWEGYMLTDIEALFACDGILMLPNWKDSKGARIEHAIALEMGKKVFYHSLTHDL